MRTFAAIVIFLTLAAGTAMAQTTEFTYQGSLQNGGSPATGNYDFEFRLYDAVSGGAQLGTTITRTSVAVANGTFAVKLDFGNLFPGSNRFLDISVRQTGGGAFTPLTPRQAVSNTPYAVKSLTADTATTAVTATNATQLGGVAANQYVVTTDPRMTDARPPTPGSASYIQNVAPPEQQASSNFSISGDGTAGGTLSGQFVNSTFQYKLAGQPFLGSVLTNSFFGSETGSANVGDSNTFAGYRAGNAATSNASNNAFFGANAGRSNSNGLNNSFFGVGSGGLNTFGGFNSFFGNNSGAANTLGNRNVFVGVTAGRDNIDGSDNVFVGVAAGQHNGSGGDNSFFGSVAGTGNTTGSNNSFFGRGSGNLNVSGNFNTALGSGANVGSGALTFATAVGAGAIASTSNTIALGRNTGQDTVNVPGTLNVTGAINGTVANASQLGGIPSSGFIQNTTTQQASSNFNISGTGTADILNAATQYNLSGNRVLGNAGTNNLFVGLGAGNVNSGTSNAFVGAGAGVANTTGFNNTFIGKFAGSSNTEGGGNTFIGANVGSSNMTGGTNVFVGSNSGVANTTGGSNAFFGTSAGETNISGNGNTLIGTLADVTAPNLSYATAIGAGATVGTSNTIALGRSGGQDTVVVPGTLTVTGAINGTVANASNATTANNAQNLGGIPASGFIQNTNIQQAASNFNISGTGTADILNVATQYNIGGNRILSTPGTNNLFSGRFAGAANTTGQSNAFFGSSAGASNISGVDNAFFGYNSGTNSNGSSLAFFGSSAGFSNTGNSNAFFGAAAGMNNGTGSQNAFFGQGAGFGNTTGANNTAVGYNANVASGNLTNATAIGAGAQVSQNNSLVLGGINGVNAATADTNVGIGTTAPAFRLDVADRIRIKQKAGSTNPNDSAGIFFFQNTPNANQAFLGMENDSSVGFFGVNGGGWGLVMNTQTGVASIRQLGAAGFTQLCRNSLNEISTCSSSLRFKTNISKFSQGMAFVNKLRPISFDWKVGGMKDIGFGAEDIAKIDPRFVTYNSAGEVEGVKYDRLSVAFVNAFKEQQAEISDLRAVSSEQARKIEDQQKQIDALKEIVCTQNPTAAVCKK